MNNSYLCYESRKPKSALIYKQQNKARHCQSSCSSFIRASKETLIYNIIIVRSMSRKTPWVLPQHDSPDSLILFVSEFFVFFPRKRKTALTTPDNAFVPNSSDIITTLWEEQHSLDRIHHAHSNAWSKSEKSRGGKNELFHTWRTSSPTLFLWFMKAFRGIQAREETWPPEAAPTISSRLHSAPGMGA